MKGGRARRVFILRKRRPRSAARPCLQPVAPVEFIIARLRPHVIRRTAGVGGLAGRLWRSTPGLWPPALTGKGIGGRGRLVRGRFTRNSVALPQRRSSLPHCSASAYPLPSRRSLASARPATSAITSGESQIAEAQQGHR
jgi:hypothetical protein